MLLKDALSYCTKIFWYKYITSLNLNAKKVIYTIFALIYCHFSLSIISAKLYLCPRYGKGTKSTSGLTRNLNAYKCHKYPTI